MFAPFKHSRLELGEPLIAQKGLYFCASSQAQPDWPQVWLILKFKCKEGAALSFLGNKLYKPLNPGWLAWKLEGIAILKLLHLLV